MSEPREWWIDPDYEGYFDDTDENLIAGGFVRAVEKSYADKLAAELAEAAFSRTDLKNKLKNANVTESCLRRALAAAEKERDEARDCLKYEQDAKEAYRARMEELEAEVERLKIENATLSEHFISRTEYDAQEREIERLKAELIKRAGEEISAKFAPMFEALAGQPDANDK